MGYWDSHGGPYRDYHRDPFPHSLLRTRESSEAHRNYGFLGTLMASGLELPVRVCGLQLRVREFVLPTSALKPWNFFHPGPLQALANWHVAATRLDTMW